MALTFSSKLVHDLMALTFGSELVRDQRLSPRIAGSRTRLEQKEEDYPPKVSSFLEMLVPLGP
jgi:hypothetical protein